MTQVNARVLKACSRIALLRGVLEVSVRREDGQGVVEYSLVLLFIAMAVVLLLPGIGKDVAAVFEKVGEAF